MSAQRAIDVSRLPTFAFGHRSEMFWGLMGMLAVESTMFGLLIASYLYLRWREPEWPPAVFPPDLTWGTVNTLLLLASVVPTHLGKKAAEGLDLIGVRFWLIVCLAFATGSLLVRAVEFTALNVYWDTNAYGSVVWVLMGMHTAHTITDAYDTGVLTILMFKGPVEGKRYSDVVENQLYWYFVVISWLAVYAIVYLAPHVL
jgi:heme/copper-type cytochrome/quinol oxidase subunit 3